MNLIVVCSLIYNVYLDHLYAYELCISACMANTFVVCGHACMRAVVLQITYMYYTPARFALTCTYVYTYTVVNTYVYSVKSFAYLIYCCIMIALK